MAKVMISIPDKLLKEIDRAAKREFDTRSGFIRKRVLRAMRAGNKYQKVEKENTELIFIR